MQSLLYWLPQLQPEDQPQVGMRAWQLAQLQHQGYAVPLGFVVSAAVFQQLSQPIDAKSGTIDHLLQHPKHLQAISHHRQQLFQDTPIPASIQAALQSALQTLLDRCPGHHLWLRISLGEALTEAAHELLSEQWLPTGDWHHFQTALQALWVDLLGARNLIYWQSHGISRDRLTAAVMVQALPPPIAHGILHVQPESWQFKVLANPLDSPIETIASQAWLSANHPQIDFPSHPPSLGDASEALDRLIALGQALYSRHDQPQQIRWMLHLNADHRPTLMILDLLSDRTLRSRPPSVPPPPRPRIATSSPRPIGEWLLQGTPIGHQHCRGPAIVLDSATWDTELPPGTIAVVKTLPPSGICHLHQALALITEEGGLTSHGAIMARELGLPAIVGASGATTQIHTGDWLRIEDGQIYRMTSPTSPALPPSPASMMNPIAPGRPSHRDRLPWPITATQLFVTMSQPEGLSAIADLPIAGLGLLRSEHLLARHLGDRSPADWLAQVGADTVQQQIAELLGQFVASFSPRPVFYRTLDWYSDANLGVLGVHGSLSYCLSPDWFQTELAAIAQVQRQSPHSPLRIVLPFVRTLEEFQQCRRSIAAAGLLDIPQVELWMMAEVPAVVFTLAAYIAAGVQGILIGTGDLSQLLFGLDRERSGLLDRIVPHHPALLQAVSHLIATAQQHQIPSLLCSHFPTPDTHLLDAVIHQGITGLSVSPDAIAATGRAIAEAEQRCLLRELRDRRPPAS